jgi:hydrogenase maturation protease
MNTRRIIGCGNLHRGDDAAGLLAVRRLRELGIPAEEESGEALSLIESWKDCQEVILIDAVVTRAQPGTINFWNAGSEGTLPADVSKNTSTHGLGLAQAIELARSLDRLPPKLFIYGIEGSLFEVGTTPSPRVLAAVETLAQKIAIDWNGNGRRKAA